MKRNFLTFLVAISLVFIPLCFAEITGQLGGMDSDGNYYWTVDDDGTLIGGTGAEISLGGEEKSSWGSVISPMTDYTGYVAPTDAGSKLKLHDDGDLTLGGAVATNVVITFDSDTNDYYIGVNDTENELQIGYGSAIGTTEQISIQSSGVIMIGEDTDVDSGFVFQSGAQDVYMGIDYTGGIEEDLFCIGLGATIGVTPELAIGKATGAVYVNLLDAPGAVDLDIGSADVTDVTVVTDGGTIILDGTITLTGSEVISNATDDTVRVASNDLDSVLEVYSPYTTDGDATLLLTTDADADAGDRMAIVHDGATNSMFIQSDTASADTLATIMTIAKTGVVTTTNYIDSKITDTTANAVVDVLKLTHDGGTAATGVGTGLVFQVDDAGGIEEQASIDVALTTVTDGAEDADIIFSQNTAGTIAESLRLVAASSATASDHLQYTANTTETDLPTNVLVLKTATGTAVDGYGMSISFQPEDATGSEEVASLDIIQTTADRATNDTDFVFSQNINGTITETFRLNADSNNTMAEGLEIADATDASDLTTASLETAGGIACAKQLYLGDDIDMSVSGTGVYDITLKTNVADALSITDGTDIMVFDTTTGTPTIAITPATTVTGTLTATGAIVANGAVTLGNAVTDVVTVTGKVAGATPLSFDGVTADAVYTILAVDDAASASKTVTLPSVTGTVMLTGAATAITAGTAPALTVTKGNQLFTDTITTDDQDQTITFSGGGAAGDRVTIIFITDTGGSLDEIITFHTTLANTTGTLTLANLTAGRYVIEFVSDGTVWNEVSRTGAQS